MIRTKLDILENKSNFETKAPKSSRFQGDKFKNWKKYGRTKGFVEL